jgi:hypothetical protein
VSDRDARINRVIKQVDVDEALPLSRTRTAARLRQGTEASAVDAVVAEAAVRTRAAFLVTSDPDDMGRLLDARAGRHPRGHGVATGQVCHSRCCRPVARWTGRAIASASRSARARIVVARVARVMAV